MIKKKLYLWAILVVPCFQLGGCAPLGEEGLGGLLGSITGPLLGVLTGGAAG